MMFKIKANPNEWKRDIYIAKKLEIDLDDEGNEIVIYDEPVKYSFTVSTPKSYAEIAEFGEKVGITRKIVVPIELDKEFKEFDVAYIDTTPEEETRNGINADYRLLPPRVGNSVIVIYLEKILGK